MAGRNSIPSRTYSNNPARLPAGKLLHNKPEAGSSHPRPTAYAPEPRHAVRRHWYPAPPDTLVNSSHPDDMRECRRDRPPCWRCHRYSPPQVIPKSQILRLGSVIPKMPRTVEGYVLPSSRSPGSTSTARTEDSLSGSLAESRRHDAFPAARAGNVSATPNREQAGLQSASSGRNRTRL